MTANEQLLVAIHKNAEMGRNTLDKLLPECRGEIRGVIEKQHDEYRRIFMAADTLLKSMDGKDDGVPAMGKIMSDLMIEMQTLTDKSTPHIAEMVLRGVDMGIQEITDAMEKLRLQAKPETVRLAETLQKALHRNKEILQRFTTA